MFALYDSGSVTILAHQKRRSILTLLLMPFHYTLRRLHGFLLSVISPQIPRQFPVHIDLQLPSFVHRQLIDIEL